MMQIFNYSLKIDIFTEISQNIEDLGGKNPGLKSPLL